MFGDKNFSLGPKIGKGATSAVYRARYNDPRGGQAVEMAVKIVDKIQLVQEGHNEFVDKFFPREIELLKKIKHPYIIGIYSILESKSKVYIFQRLAERGDLLQQIQKRGRIEFGLSRSWFKQILDGIQYIHDLGYAHRDIKCENIFISANNNIKIGDFGYAKEVIKNRKMMLSRTFCGSILYAAPEVIRGIPYDAQISDIFSVGVVLYAMVTGVMPFTENNDQRLVFLQYNRRYNRNENIEIPKDCWEIIWRLLEPEAVRRCSLQDVKKMKWLN